MPDTSTSRRPWYAFLTGGALVAALGATIPAALAQRVLWSDSPALSAAARPAAQPLAHFRSVSFQLTTLRSVLQSAPAGRGVVAATSATVISLPLPDGSSQRFRVVQAPVMAPELAAKYPAIQTYAAQGIDDPTATARLDISPDGFHALILASDKTVYIDPAVRGTEAHLVFERRAMNRAAFPFVCATPAATEVPALSSASRAAGRAAVANGTTLRTYRLALACTGEYAAFHGGTRAGALAGMVASVNRVNAIYERELAVRLVLVANNDRLIFLNPTTDPYSNTDGEAMLEENQTVADSLIGPSNYDIGHVFSTGGGGIAQRPSVCISGKARGVTGSPSPINDAFDVDYVAHEMGHQFGADHTFNSTADFCSGNREASSAYEPGSGSTIMAYAGICGADNLQPNSDPYFHSHSFDQIVAHITGPGNCSVNTATGNTPPVVNAGASYAIPVRTPFVLTGSATDANADALTYVWEELNLGPNGALNAPTGDAPIFRSFTPTSSPTRTFPRLTDLLNNSQTPGELLPTYGRRLIFRLVARDNRAGGGGVDYDSMQVVVVPTAGPFVVRSPNSATSWLLGAPQQVIWDVANTNQAPISAATVNILLSTDGGLTYPTVLAANTPNDGFEAVTVPASVGATSTARVRVQASAGIFFDISNQNLTLTAPTGPTFFLQTADAATLAFCPGNSATIPLSLGQLQGFSGNVTLAATNLPAGVTVTYAANPVAAGSATTATITADASAAAGTYTLQLTGTSGGVTRVLDVLLTIRPSAIQAATVTTPAAGGLSTLRPRITWTAVPNAISYEVQVATDAAFTNLVVNQTGITGTTFTTLLLQPTTTYYARVRGVSACATAPYSATRQLLTGTHTLRTATATQVPRTIGTTAGATTTSTIVIGNTERVSDLRIRDLALTHPDISELEITLTNPARRQTVLLARACPGTNSLNVSLADDGAALACPPAAAATVRPAGYLGDLLNDPAFGSWTLSIRDTRAGNGGTLTGWKLELYTLNEPPAAPSGLSVLAPVVTNNMASLDLVWLDDSGTETGFEIERAQFGGAFTRIATVGTNVTAYTDQVRTNGTFCYRVRAINAFGASGYSNEACQTVSTVTGIASAALLPGVEVSPNPSTGLFQVKIDNAHRGPITLWVADGLGRSLSTQTFKKAATVLQCPLDLTPLAPGVYNLHLDMPDGSAVVRLLKQ